MHNQKKFIADSCFFIALLLEKDSCHEKAVFLMDAVDQDNQIMLLLPRIIEETITVFTYKKEYQALTNFLILIREKENIEYIENNHNEELRFFERNNERISFIDSSLLHHSKKLGVPIISFDKKLITLSKRDE